MGNKADTTYSLFPAPAKENRKSTPARAKAPIAYDEKARAYWDECLVLIKDNISSQVFKTWFEPIQAVKFDDGQLTLHVPSQFFCEWIETHYYDLLQKTIQRIISPDARLQYEVLIDESIDKSCGTMKVQAFKYPPPPGSALSLTFEDSAPEPFVTNLNPSYAFENYITGESNQLASSAARAIAENPGGTRFNILFIYGDTGLGKTHLAQAIGNRIVNKYPKKKVLYTNSENFTFEFVNSLQNNKLNDFTQRYRNVDVLIIDDIQFFSRKEKIQDNFFHTFNALHQAGKQIILTSDKSTKELRDVDERLISRFQWGLTVDIQPPELEMRMAILQKKSLDEGIQLSGDILAYIAENVKFSIRELEGALIGLIAKHTFENKPLTLETAMEVVTGLTKVRDGRVTIDDIIDQVCRYYEVSREEVSSKSRKREFALARQMAMYLAKQHTSLSLKAIGAKFSNRDHSTVLHSCGAIADYLRLDKKIASDYEAISQSLKRIS